jgi:acetolactate synthase-1/2/3 large subunit
MKKTGAFLVVHALEQIGIQFTFGIPGVHNTEIYDALNNSKQIEPILVTHEGGAAFMADGVSRTSDSIGTLVIVPAAGTTHAMSGIGEAYLDGIPMLVISGGTRRDSGRHYQLHQIDQEQIVGGLVKKYFLVEKHEDIVPTIYEAYQTATSGEPGPVFVEIPAELQLFQGAVKELPVFEKAPASEKKVDPKLLEQAVDMLLSAKHPGIYAGWGAVDASAQLQEIATLLSAPVATTLQGKSTFPANHSLHTGVGFGASAVPAGQEAFKKCDGMLAVGVRFSELATGSYGVQVPEKLIHIDINPTVFHKNYPAKVAIEGDAQQVLDQLLVTLKQKIKEPSKNHTAIEKEIAKNKKQYEAEWTKKELTEKVSPGFFFRSLREQLPEDVLMVVDDGKHTFLAAELFPVYKPRHFISPTDFNCMGYCVPASIGVKLANPDKEVVAIVGDGAFMMTGMELLTATSHGLGIMVFVFHDGELGQISQFQKIPLNRKTCTVIGQVNLEGVAMATGAAYLPMNSDQEIDETIAQARSLAAEGRPVLVDVKIDYAKKTFLTKGVVKTNLGRFPTSEKMRFIGRALKRHVLG